MIHENLKEYIDGGAGTEKELARKLGISIAYINMLKHGHRRPAPDLALKIEKLTGIPFRSWYQKKTA